MRGNLFSRLLSFRRKMTNFEFERLRLHADYQFEYVKLLQQEMVVMRRAVEKIPPSDGNVRGAPSAAPPSSNKKRSFESNTKDEKTTSSSTAPKKPRHRRVLASSSDEDFALVPSYLSDNEPPTIDVPDATRPTSDNITDATTPPATTATTTTTTTTTTTAKIDDYVAERNWSMSYRTDKVRILRRYHAACFFSGLDPAIPASVGVIEQDIFANSKNGGRYRSRNVRMLQKYSRWLELCGSK